RIVFSRAIPLCPQDHRPVPSVADHRFAWWRIAHEPQKTDVVPAGWQLWIQKTPLFIGIEPRQILFAAATFADFSWRGTLAIEQLRTPFVFQTLENDQPSSHRLPLLGENALHCRVVLDAACAKRRK